MNIDLSKYKVIYNERVLRALAIVEIYYGEERNCETKEVHKPKFIGVMVINEDGTIEIINDETWCFQFLPIINEQRR